MPVYLPVWYLSHYLSFRYLSRIDFYKYYLCLWIFLNKSRRKVPTLLDVYQRIVYQMCVMCVYVCASQNAQKRDII